MIATTTQTMERNDRSGKSRWKDDALQLVTKCSYTYSFEMYDARLNDWLENLEKERERERDEHEYSYNDTLTI